MRAVIILAQGTGDYGRFDKRDDDLIIAADGGCYAAANAGVTPSVLAGDMDSVGSIPECDEIIKLPTVKDDTDAHFCAKLAVERGCGEVLLLGGTGGRLDHTLANLHTLAFLAKNKIKASLRDGQTEIYMLNGQASITLEAGPGRRMALIAYGGDAHGVCSSGVEYPLEDAVLTPDFPLGVSNTVTAQQIRVSVKNGLLAVMLM